MPSTTTGERGAIALVRFVFADEEGAKRRPVLILSGGEYQAGLRAYEDRLRRVLEL